MLRFVNKPDRVFTKILTDAIINEIFWLGEAIEYEDASFCTLPNKIIDSFGGKIEGCKMLKNTFDKLLKAHMDKKNVYMPTDRHFLLLHYAVIHQAEIYSDMSYDYKDEDKYKTSKGKVIDEINGNNLIDWFFHDTDYLFDPVVAKKLMKEKSIQKMSDISDVALRASMNCLVDASDLVLENYGLASDKSVWIFTEKYDWLDEYDEDEL